MGKAHQGTSKEYVLHHAARRSAGNASPASISSRPFLVQAALPLYSYGIMNVWVPELKGTSHDAYFNVSLLIQLQKKDAGA